EVFSKSKDKKASMEAKGAEINIEVKGIMSTPPVSLGPQNKVSEALDLMIKKDISSVVVVKDENPVGIVTQIDLLELLTSFRESPQLYVQITGLEEDSEVYDIMYDIIRKVMKRISKIVNPKVLNLHVVQHHHVGLRSKYAFRARMITDKKMYYTSAFEWDLLKALDEVMKQLEKTIKKEKERRLDRRKHRKKS
ncbi:MAG: CBS domain-containing protein, partial [Thermoplasmata archaeon]|nr:CBS domain-containing protein [Thermoplasmata archaeon]